MGSHIKIGTRKSPLAQWQASWVAQQLESSGVSSELVLMDTKGDRQLNVGIPEIGSKGVFTEDLEQSLAAGEIDIAVHSAKDMPSELPAGFELIAFTPRENAHDVLVSDVKGLTLDQCTLVGTSSTRRVAFLCHYHPNVKTVGVRGNLQTRIKKMEEGTMDGLILAYAGVHRMGLEHLIQQELPAHQFVPAVGQGSLAIEVHYQINAEKKSLLSDILNHASSSYCVEAERAFLKTLQGGCSIPAFAHATLKESTLNIQGGVVSLDGSQKVEFTFHGGIDDRHRLGQQLALKILEAGGDDILEQIKKQLKIK